MNAPLAPRARVALVTFLAVFGISCGQARGPETLVKHEFFSIMLPGTTSEETGTDDDPHRCWTTHAESSTPVGVLMDRYSGLPRVSSVCVSMRAGPRTLGSETERAITSFTKIFGTPSGDGKIVSRITTIELSGLSGNEVRLEEKGRGFVLRARVFVSGNVGITASVLGSSTQVVGKRASAFLDSLALSERFTGAPTSQRDDGRKISPH